MGRVTDFLLGRVTAAPVAQRDATPSPIAMVGFPNEGGLISGGVTALTALGLSAVWRSLDILCNGVSQLEWRELRGNLELPPSRLVLRPQAARTRREWVSWVVSCLALFDVTHLLKVGGRDGEGVTLGLWPIEPTLITPVIEDMYTLLPPSEYWIGGMRAPADELVILHRSPQPYVSETLGGVLNLARTTFAAALAAERYASRYWQAGGAPTTVLEATGMVPPPIATQIEDRWRDRRAKGPDYAPLLTNGVSAKAFGADPTTESAVVARKELVADIGRYFGVPTSLLNAPTGDSETYSSTEAQGIHLVNYTLRNYIHAIEDGITDQLPGGRRLSIDVSPLTRGTQYTRAQAWNLAVGSQPWMSPDEVREAEGLPPLEVPLVRAPVAGGIASG